MTALINDGSILVCVKPAGIMSQKAEGNGPSVQDSYPDTELFTVHRLDRETGGVMVFAENSACAAALSEQIRQNKFEKRYFAVLKGKPEAEEGVLEDLLFRDKQKNKTFVVKRERRGVRKASLEYKTLGCAEGLTLIQIKLHTGRTHQIRVQFSSRGLPLYGDGRYGGGAGELALFAYYLSFYHPITGEKMRFTHLPDTDKYPWNQFREILTELNTEDSL